MAFSRDGEDALEDRHHRRSLEGGVAREGPHRGEAGVSAPDDVAPLALEMVEESEDQRRVEVFER